MLHIIRTSGFNNNALAQCLDTTLEQDSLLLIDDGCYNLHHPLLLEILMAKTELKCFYIGLHASARAQFKPAPVFTEITLDDVNELIFSHHNSITWS